MGNVRGNSRIFKLVRHTTAQAPGSSKFRRSPSKFLLYKFC